MSLSVPLSKEQMRVASNLINGNTEWEDLSHKDKRRVLAIHNRGIDVTDTVEPEKLYSFERKMEALEGGGDDEVGMIDRVMRSLPV